MKWAPQAEVAIKKVPFFIRKKVTQKVEAYAQGRGKSQVDLEDVISLKKQFLSKGGMEKEVKGYDISTCFGREGCPNIAHSTEALFADIQPLMDRADLLSFLKTQVREDLKFHHDWPCKCPDSFPMTRFWPSWKTA